VRLICLCIALGFGGGAVADGAAFVPVPGNLAQLSVGFDGTTWGVNAGGQIYRWDANTNTWDWIPGALAEVAVGSSNAVWGVNAAGEIYRWNANANAWDTIRGTLAQVAIGADGGCWRHRGAKATRGCTPMRTWSVWRSF